MADRFNDGQPFDFALWRVPTNELDTLELRVLPLYPERAVKLPVALRISPPLTAPRAEVVGIEALERRQWEIEFPTPAARWVP